MPSAAMKTEETDGHGAGGRFEATLEPCALGAALPESVLIAPWGAVASANGDFLIDDESAEALIEAFAAHGTDLPIDYEHQSLGGPYAAPSGQAPAAGWIRALRAVRPGEESENLNSSGIWAQVEWTDSGRERVAAREYRYLSPVVLVRRSDRRVVALHSAALTNKPAIVGMRPIVNAAGGPAGEGSRVAAPVPAAAAELRSELGLDERADLPEVLIAAGARIQDLRRERAEQAAAERVTAAARAGKVPASLRAWAMHLALSDPACFDAWAAAAPVMVATGRTTAPRESAPGRDRTAVIASARAVYRSEPALASLTSEEAWIAQAVREAGIESEKVRK